MKKIPTLFERTFENHKVAGILPKVTPGCEWVLEGKGEATLKYDGACCAVINGKLYKRYDAKGRKKVPAGSIPCCDPDPVTGHWPHWAPVSENNPSDKWFVEAYNSTLCDPILCSFVVNGRLKDGTYEAVGPHFQGNPHNFSVDWLCAHGKVFCKMERTFDGIRKALEESPLHEGFVFWLDGEPRCKIKRKDFGFEWPAKI